MALRDYQVENLKEVKKVLTKLNSVLYVAPTGAGKSVLTAEFVDDLVTTGKKVLVLAHRRQLLNQMKNHFEGKGITTGKIVGKIEENLDADIMVASIHTVTRDKRIENILAKVYDYIIVDEAHRIASESYDKVIDKAKELNQNLKLVGLTATPIRRDKKDLGKYFHQIVESADVEQLIKAGYLSKYRIFGTPVKDLDTVEKNSNDYKQIALSTYMKAKERVDYAVESYKMFGEDRQMLVFCVDKTHAKEVIAAYNLAGYNDVAYIDADTKEADREAILDGYKNKTIKIIVSIETLVEGVDLPETGCIQLLRPTKSLTIYMQSVGRGLRLKEDGSDLIILDNAGCTQEFGTVSAKKQWSLDPTINPCNPTAKNKVVGRRKDGTYTDNLTEDEFVELEELSHDEYLEKMINSLEEAENFNKQLEVDFIKNTILLASKVLENAGVKDYTLDENIKTYTKEYVFKNVNDSAVGIVLNLENNSDGSKRIDFSMKNAYYSSSLSFKQKQKIFSDLNKIYTYYSADNREKKLAGEFLVLQLELDGKVDIGSLREKQKNAKREKTIAKINESILAGENKIVLSKSVRLDRIYPSVSSGWRENVQTIMFKKSQLLVGNHIVLLNEVGGEVYESKSAKLDKVLEILEYGKYEL